MCLIIASVCKNITTTQINVLHYIISRNTYLLLEDNVFFITCTNESFTGNYKQQIGWFVAGSWRNRVPAAGATCALWMETVSGGCCGFWAPSDKYFSPDLILHNTETLKPLMNIKRIAHICPISKALDVRIRPDATVTNRREPRLHKTHSDRGIYCPQLQPSVYSHSRIITTWIQISLPETLNQVSDLDFRVYIWFCPSMQL